MTYMLQILTADLSDAQLGTLAFAFSFLALCVTFGLGSILWGK